MKGLALFAIVVLTGCLGVETPSTTTQTGTGGAHEQGEPSDYHEDHGPGPCGVGSTVEQVTLGGNVIYVEIPAICDPYAEDHGDPPPERQQQDFVDYDPFKGSDQPVSNAG